MHPWIVLQWLRLAALVNAVLPAVSGSPVTRFVHHSLSILGLVVFCFSAYSILLGMFTNETLTSVEMVSLEEVTFPTIFACLSPATAQYADSSAIYLESLSGFCAGMRNVATVTDGMAEIATTGKCVNFTTIDKNGMPLQGEDEKNQQILRGLSSTFHSRDYCFLINADGEFTTTPSINRELVLTITQLGKPIVGVSLYAIAGFYEQGGSPFDSKGHLNTPYFRLGFQNVLTSVGVSFDTLVDQTGTSLLPKISGGTTKYLYKASVSTSVLYYQPISNTSAEEPGTEDYQAGVLLKSGFLDGNRPNLTRAGAESIYVFYLNNFVSQTVTLRSTSVAEFWAAIGGAIGGGAIFVQFLFREEIQEDTTGGGVSKSVQVCRLWDVHDGARALKTTLSSARLSTTVAPSGAGETYVNGVRMTDMSALRRTSSVASA